MKRWVGFLLLFFLLFIFAPAWGESDLEKIKGLLKDLKSPEYEKAWNAASNLSKFPQYKSQIVPALIEALNYEWDRCAGDIRESIAYSLAQLKAKEAVFPLLELLKSGKNIDHECAECGCCFLALTPEDEITERFFDPFCHNSALKAIHQLADFSHSKAMADLVAEGKWKPELLITLGQVGLPRYAHFISRYKDDKEVSVGIAVAQALGLIENDEITIPVLLQLLSRKKEDFAVKWAAAESLIKIGKRKENPRLKSQLAGLLKEGDKFSGALAARSLANLGDEKGILKLRPLASDNDPKIRFEAILYLGELSDSNSKEIFIKRLQDESLAVRAAAIYALGRIGDPSVVPLLQKALEEANRYEDQLQAQFKSGDGEKRLREKYGFQVYDLRETRQRAVDNIQKKGGKIN